MKISQTETSMISEIIENVVSNNKEWLKLQSINVAEKDRHWMLNYKLGDRNEYNRLVRGMVIEKPSAGFSGNFLSLIKSFPFVRFFNYKEVESGIVDFKNMDMIEKLDGTFVGIFIQDGKPEYHTRSMISLNSADMRLKLTTFHGKSVKYLESMRHFVDELKFNTADLNFSFMFEFIHENSKVVTKYEPHQYGLYLLGIRDLRNYQELSEEELDEFAIRINSKRARRFDCVTEYSQIKEVFKIHANAPDFEGFIFRDRITNQRVKIKDPDYVAKHHMIDNLSIQNLIPLILKGEEAEIVAYFPSAQANIDLFKKCFSDYIEKAFQKIKYYQSFNLSEKELAIKLFGVKVTRKERLAGVKNPVVLEKDPFISSAIVSYSQIKDDDAIRSRITKYLERIALGQGTNEGVPLKLIQLIGLDDKES